MFWESMSPDGSGEPSGELARAIDSAFGSYAGALGGRAGPQLVTFDEAAIPVRPALHRALHL